MRVLLSGLLLVGIAGFGSGVLSLGLVSPLPGQEDNRLVATSLEEPANQGKAKSTPSPRGDNRILFVSDPSSVAIGLLPDPVEEQHLRRWVNMLADSGVDLFNQEIYSQGWTEYWKSRSFDYDQRTQHRRFLPMIESGTQPVEVLIDQSHKRGMTFIAGFRVNDNHAYLAKKQGVRLAKFIEEHPEWRLKGFPDEAYYRLSSPLDFSFQGPRDFFHSVIEEVVTRFDVDGIELCFRDHGYFKHGTGRSRKKLMTGLVRRIRATVNKAGESKGKRLLIGARVFPTLEECLFLGLDVATWISEGLLDYVSPQDVMYADFNVPFEEFAALTRDSKCMLYPAMLPWSSLRARIRLNQQPLTQSNQRALAATMYGAGADGVAIYNHFTTMWHPPFYPQSLRFFHELRDPKRIAAGTRHYIFEPTWADSEGFGLDKPSTGFVKAQRVVLDRKKSKARGTYEFRLFDDLSDCQATLTFRGFHLTANDKVAVILNGRAVGDKAIGRTASTGASRDQRSVSSDGRTYGLAPEEGRIEFRRASKGALINRPDPVFSTRWFDLKGLPIRRGVNRLSITLTRSDPMVNASIVIDEVEIWVQP